MIECNCRDIPGGWCPVHGGCRNYPIVESPLELEALRQCDLLISSVQNNDISAIKKVKRHEYLIYWNSKRLIKIAEEFNSVEALEYINSLEHNKENV